MKTKHLFLLPTLIAGFGLIPVGPATAQVFTTLHSFTPTNGVAGTNGDGANPYAGLILSGKTLYGATYGGGNAGKGSVFANTMARYKLASFTARFDSSTNSDRRVRRPAQILSDNTPTDGFANSGGPAVFKLNTDGTGLRTSIISRLLGLHQRRRVNPYPGLMLSGNRLYGAGFWRQCEARHGVLLAFDGTGFTNLHTFAAGSGSWPKPPTATELIPMAD
jgi:hypothetical protein